MTRPSVTVQIDALDLRAVPAPRRAAVADAFVRELTALIEAGEPTWPRDAGTPGATTVVDVSAAPHRVGAALARSVYRSLSTQGTQTTEGGLR